MTERRPRRAAGALAALLVTAAAHGQSSAIERCRQEPSDAERIACLEAALAGTSATEAEAREPQPADRAAAQDIGAEQVRARERSKDDLAVARGLTVARYVTVPYRRLQVELANGQVWRQIEGDTQRIRVDLERNRTVDIEESPLGGYKLKLVELGRTIRVERIR